MILVWTVIVGAALASFAGTAWVRRYALRRGVLDHPNARSSHSIPTPRGGGVAIAIAFLAGLTIFWSRGLVASELLIALLGAGGWITPRRLDRRSAADSRALAPSRTRAGLRLGVLLARRAAAIAGRGGRGRAGLGRNRRGSRLPRLGAEPLQLHGRDRCDREHRGRDSVPRRAPCCTGPPPPASGRGSCPPCYWPPWPASCGGTTRRRECSWATRGAASSVSCWRFLRFDSVGLGQRFFWAWTILIGVFVVDASVTLLRRIGRRERSRRGPS